jgi:hypothetical protein
MGRMAQRPEDPADDPADDARAPADPRASEAVPGEPDKDDFEDAWARIVADLSADGTLADAGSGATPPGPSASPAPPEAAGDAVDPGLAALFDPLRPAAAAAAPEADAGAFVDNWADEGHFVPPPPPELPEGTPLKRLGWAGLLGGPATLALVSFTGWDPPRLVTVAAAVATLAGFLTLVWQLPEAREDSGWDDGARL